MSKVLIFLALSGPSLGFSPSATFRLSFRLGASTLEPLATSPGADSSTPSAKPQEALVDETSTVRPGEDENELFREVTPSVKRWKEYTPKNLPPEGQAMKLPMALENVQSALARAARNGQTGGVIAARYWAYHAGRIAFFSSQNILAVALNAATLFSSNNKGEAVADEAMGRATRKEAQTSSLLDAPNVESTLIAVSSLLCEAVETFEQDFENIQAGFYKEPWDMEMGLRHRQASLPYIADKARRLLGESTQILSRRRRALPEDRKVWKFSSKFRSADSSASTSSSKGSSLYPEYYQTNFHYQTDGWMSADSAAVYESATESLFFGRQDAMQRGSLVPLSKFVKQTGGKGGRGVSMLEVACGTGRLATFARDNFPAMEVALVDLSPYYLEEARQNHEYWEKARGASLTEELGIGSLGGVSFEQAAAENLPYRDESFDVVTCVYLFHELPPAVRRACSREFARVLKPGGLLVLTDSVQRGDRMRSYDDRLDLFTNLNEPFYKSYVRENLGQIMVEEASLEPVSKHVTSVSKTLAFTKKKASKQKAQEEAQESIEAADIAEP
mmetsp:Transcript_23235/g.52386  ORF Transcript_23235/g.52386 Transcript_23235/m.52386 type:complete len:560 (+) Transcript_23235:103-1782(+)